MASNARTGRPRNRPTVKGFPASRARGVYATSRSVGQEPRGPEVDDGAHQPDEPNGSSSSSASTITEQDGPSNTQDNPTDESPVEQQAVDNNGDIDNPVDPQTNELADHDNDSQTSPIDPGVQPPGGSPRATPVVPPSPPIPDNASTTAAYGSDSGSDFQLDSVQLEPVQIEPVQLEPVQLEPVQLEPTPPNPPNPPPTNTDLSIDPPIDTYQSPHPLELNTHRRLVDQSLSAFGIDLKHDDRGRVSRFLSGFEKQFRGGSS